MRDHGRGRQTLLRGIMIRRFEKGETMKKVIIILSAIIMIISLCACGNDVKESSGTTSENNGSVQTEAKTNTPVSESAAKENGTTENEKTTSVSETASIGEQIEGNEGLAISEHNSECIITGLGTCNEKDLIIPSHYNGKPVKMIDEEAFRGTSITSVIIPWTIEKVDEDAFEGCSALASVTFSEGMLSISDAAFAGCTSLTEIVLPKSLIGIGRSAFEGCVSLEKATFLGAPRIGNRAFDMCSSLKSVVIKGESDYDCYLENNVFSGCVSLESFSALKGLKQIGTWSFANCASLKTVYLPDSLSDIKSCAFLRSGVEKVFYSGSKEEWEKIKIEAQNDPITSAEIQYDVSTIDLY